MKTSMECLDWKFCKLLQTSDHSERKDSPDKRAPEDQASKLDPYGQLTHDEFLNVFNIQAINDPEEKEMRAKALKINQEAVLEHNKRYLAGHETWIAMTNHLSDIPNHKFDLKRIGDVDSNYTTTDKKGLILEDQAIGLDPYGQLSYDQFSEVFHVPIHKDKKEREVRTKALKVHQEEVLGHNKLYMAGMVTWFEMTNEFSNVPNQELRSALLGVPDHDMNKKMFGYSTDMLPKLDWIGADLNYEVPPSYNSIHYGYVSPVKNQRSKLYPKNYCASCSAFAVMALVETCYKKKVGVFGDYSEQHLMDCSHGNPGIAGCQGAYPHSYAYWLANVRPAYASEVDYPYVAKVGKCRKDYKEYYQGAKVNNVYYNDNGNEEILKKLVHRLGAVVTVFSVSTQDENHWYSYKGGVFSACTKLVMNHAMTVVGYGTENGVDYWLVKNSWGTDWGEGGFMKIKRGVNMCGLGSTLVAVSC